MDRRRVDDLGENRLFRIKLEIREDIVDQATLHFFALERIG